MSGKSNKRRHELLGSAGTAMALMIAGSTFGVQTATAATTVSPPVFASADKIAISQSDNSAVVSASIDNTLGGVSADATSGGSNSNAATGNDVRATATGNAFHNQIDLSTVNDVSATGGAAAVGVAANQSGAAISSAVTDNAVIVDLVNFSNGSAVNDENTISATTTANKGSTLLSGPIASDGGSIMPGTVLTIGSGVVTSTSTTAGITANTHQISIDPANSATADENMIGMFIESTGANTVASSPSVSSNTIAASVSGNASQSTIAISDDTITSFHGSATMANVQESMGAGASSASNRESWIVGAINGEENTLSGTLQVEANTISSAASNNAALGNSANRAGNEILLGDSLSFAGASNPSNLLVTNAGNTYTSSTNSDLVVQNVQTALGTDLVDPLTTTASTVDALVEGYAENLQTGAISVTGNAITSTAQSNAASSRIASGNSAAAFDGSAAVSNLQSNTNVAIASQTQGSVRGSVDEALLASNVEVEGNATRASAYGNQLSQSIDLKATALDLGSSNAAVLVGSAPSVFAPIAVGNIQTNIAASVVSGQASFIGAGWMADAGTMAGSKLSASDNTQEALAVGNSSTNGLSLQGTTIGTGGAISNIQGSDATSFVRAESIDTTVNVYATGDLSNSEAQLTNNLQRSIAYGASAANALAVNGTTLEPSGAPGDGISTSMNPVAQSLTTEVEAGFAAINYQAQAGDVTALAETSAAFSNQVLGDLVEGSTQITDGNSLVAAAYGTDARNLTSIDVNTIDTIGIPGTVASAVNAQVTVDADILARAAGGSVASSSVDGGIFGSSVSTSENTVQALASANRASATQIAVNATTVATALDILGVPAVTSFDESTVTGTVNAAFGAQNAQFSSGTVTASLLSDDVDPESARFLTAIGDAVVSSSVGSDNNLSAAGATGNRAATSIVLDANQLNTSAGIQNAQMNSADLEALIGIAGTPGTPGDPGSPNTPISASGNTAPATMSVSGDTLNVSGSPVTVTFADHSFSAEEAAYLNSLSGISGAAEGGNTVTFAVGSIDTSVFNNFSFNSGADGSSTGDETFTLTGFTIPGTPPTPPTLATPNQGGVMVFIGEDIINSAVSVSGNRTSGSVTGNSASNAIIASATEISNGSNPTVSSAEMLDAMGDLAVSNLQRDTSDTQSTTVYGTFAIDAVDNDIVGSSLSVSNNSQRADAGSNFASNVIDASATNISAGTALGSAQSSSAEVSAMSDLDLFVPGASTGSAIKVTDNANTARAVVNEANSIVQVEGTNIATGAAPFASVPQVGMVSADHALLNIQAADGEANSIAASKIYNTDAASLETSGLQSGSIEFRGNSTTAQSVANLASNELTVSTNANNSANAIISNGQISSAEVSADATSSVQVILAGSDDNAPLGLAASNSAIRVNNNATTAVARGNSASNVLNLEAGATYGTSLGTPATAGFINGGLVSSFNATGGVLNQQSNTGTVSANSSDVIHRVALNGLDNSALVTGSSLSVSGNAVNAEAYGNTATNRIVMNALNSGMPGAAIGNYQSNTADVTATVAFGGYGVTAGTGAIGNSVLATTGNRIAATAVGNNAVSIIAAGN